MKKNLGKKGWIRIIEASVAILLIAGILLIILGEERFMNPNPDANIYHSQLIVLRDIQMTATLRQSVLEATVPIDSDEEGFPSDIKDRIDYFILNYLECKAKICEIGLDCDLEGLPEKSIYVQSVFLTVTKTQVGGIDPRQLKLFCWRK